MDREAARKWRQELERGNECQWFWLSFADEDGFKGGCFVLAPGFASAVERARDLGLNPGGEVVGTPIKAPPLELQNRLLSESDLESHGGAVSLTELKGRIK
jgi:hypothetical protein